MKSALYLLFAMSACAGMNIFAESPPICELQAFPIVRFFPDGKVSLLRPLEITYDPHAGYEGRYVWESVDAVSGEIEKLAELRLPDFHGLGSFDIAPDGSYALYYYEGRAAYQLDKNGTVTEIPPNGSSSFGTVGFKPNGQAMILTEIYEGGFAKNLVLIEQDSPGSSSWHSVDQIRHGHNQTCFSLALSFDENGAFVGLCDRNDGTYALKLENNKIKFTKISTMGLYKVAAAPSKTHPKFFAFDNLSNPKMVQISLINGRWHIDEIADSRDYNSSEWDALPGEMLVVDEDELIFNFNYDDPFIAKKSGSTWSLLPLTTEFGYTPIDTLNNPTRYLHMGTVQNSNSPDGNGIIILEKTSSEWSRKELSVGPLFITKKICDY